MATDEVSIVRQIDGLAQDRSCKLSDGGKSAIVGPVRNQFVAKSFENLVAADEECSGHSLNITGGKSDEVTFKPGSQHAINAFAV